MTEAALAGRIRVVLVTAPEEAVAADLARTIVTERLAACVNVVPRVRSIYRYEGAVQDDAEVLLVIKTTEECMESLCERVRALHPYDLPEVLALPAAGGSVPYLEWVCAESGR